MLCVHSFIVHCSQLGAKIMKSCLTLSISVFWFAKIDTHAHATNVRCVSVGAGVLLLINKNNVTRTKNAWTKKQFLYKYKQESNEKYFSTCLDRLVSIKIELIRNGNMVVWVCEVGVRSNWIYIRRKKRNRNWRSVGRKMRSIASLVGGYTTAAVIMYGFSLSTHFQIEANTIRCRRFNHSVVQRQTINSKSNK